MLWRNSLHDNFRGEVAVDVFFQAHLPAPSTEKSTTIADIVNACAAKLSVAAQKVGSAEVENDYAPSLIEYLKTVVSHFPKSTKPAFYDTHKTYFPSMDPQDHSTRPYIAATRAGKGIPGKWQWSAAGTVLELKLSIDIFNKEGQIGDSEDSQNALVQLAKSARSLLASGFCFVFVLAVIGARARILRFDRTGYRTSTAFNWTTIGKNVIPTFLWRLYNPEGKANQPARMYGEDDTISVPTEQEKKEMYKLWTKTSSYKNVSPAKRLSFEEATQHSRWVNAKKGDDPVRCFTIGEPLYQSDGLFSRATRIDRVVLEDDPHPTAYALKDAWKEVCRRPESDFYQVIARYCAEAGEDDAARGMAQCLGSVELPGHRTNSAGSDNHQRCHIRLLLTPVGTPLKHFDSSKQLIQALAAAVKRAPRLVLISNPTDFVHSDHRIAYEAGVIHRDVGEGNVLYDEETMESFLVDYDYAEFTVEGKKRFDQWFPDRANADSYTNIDKSLKDLTGTFPFMAIELLEKERTVHLPQHDLESFYWLLIWMILRYVAHTHKDGTLACHQLFDVDNPAAIKRNWLMSATPLAPGTPLFHLAAVMRTLMMNQNPSIPEPDDVPFLIPGYTTGLVAPLVNPITHATLETVFAAVIQNTDWTTFKDAGALVFIPPRKTVVKNKAGSRDLRRNTIIANSQGGPGTLEGSTGGLTGSGSDSKRRREADDPSEYGDVSTGTRDSATADAEGSESAPKKPKIDQMKPKSQKKPTDSMKNN